MALQQQPCTFVEFVSIVPDPITNTTTVTYELCNCDGLNINQAFFELCPPGQQSGLNEEATEDANDPNTDANFVGIFRPGQGGNELDTDAARFTSLNEQCQLARLVYNGLFRNTNAMITVQGSFAGGVDLFADVPGLVLCEQPPVECDCVDTRAPGEDVTLRPDACFAAGAFQVAFCFSDLDVECTPCTRSVPVEVCGLETECTVDFTIVTISGRALVRISRGIEGDCESEAAICADPQTIDFELCCCVLGEVGEEDCEEFEDAVSNNPCPFLDVRLNPINRNTVRPVVIIDCDAVRDAF